MQMEQQAPTQVDREAIQYVWFPFCDLAHDDVGTIKRLRWQPITRQLRWENILSKENPAEYVMTRNLENPRSNRHTEGAYWIKPGAIVNSLREQYGEWGLLVSSAAFGMPVEEFEKLGIDNFFFPEADDQLPATHREIQARIQERLDAIHGGALKGAPQAAINALVSLGQEMLASLARAYNYQNVTIADRLAEIEKAKYDNSGKYRGSLDSRDRKMLSWLEITPPDEALKKAAVDNYSLAEIAKQALLQPKQAPAIDEEKLATTLATALGAALKPLLETKAAPPAPVQNNQQKR